MPIRARYLSVRLKNSSYFDKDSKKDVSHRLVSFLLKTPYSLRTLNIINARYDYSKLAFTIIINN